MEQKHLKKLHDVQTEIMDEIAKVCEEKHLTYFLIGGTLLGAVRHKGFIPWDDDLDIAMPRKDFDIFIKECQNYLDSKFELDYISTNNKYWLPFAKIRNKNTIYQENVQEFYHGKKGIWVDIFPLDYVQNSGLEKTKRREYYIKKIKATLYLKNLRKINSNDSIKKKIAITFIKLIPNKLIHFIINKLMKGDSNETYEYFVNFGSQYGEKKQTHLKQKYFPAIELEFEGRMYKVPRDYDYVLRKIYGNDYMQLPPTEKRITHNPIKMKFEDGEEIDFKEKN